MKNRSLGLNLHSNVESDLSFVCTFLQRCRVAGTHSKQAHVPGRWRGDATASGMTSKRHSLTKGVPSSTLRLSSPRPAAPSRHESQASPETDCRFTAKATALLASTQNQERAEVACQRSKPRAQLPCFLFGRAFGRLSSFFPSCEMRAQPVPVCEMFTRRVV